MFEYVGVKSGLCCDKFTEFQYKFEFFRKIRAENIEFS